MPGLKRSGRTRAELSSIAELIAQVAPTGHDEEDLRIAEADIVAQHQETPPWFYVAASYLPDYREFLTPDETLTQVPVNTGTASLYINNQLVAQSTALEPVIDAYFNDNINDQLLILTNNNKGAIDQLAIYSEALSAETPPALPSTWEVPNSEEALVLLREAGLLIDGKTPQRGAIDGAVTAHWDARNVNPDDALLSTFYSVFSPNGNEGGSWSAPSSFDPELALVPTVASATNPSGSLENNRLISLPGSAWSDQSWSVTTNTDASPAPQTGFSPSGLKLESISVGETKLTPEQVLIGNTKLADLQPFSTDSDLNYTLLSNAPEFSLLVSNSLAGVNDQASVSFAFSNGTTATSAAQPFVLGSELSHATESANTTSATGASTNAEAPFVITSALKASNKALATSVVLEQAPLQLKYIDSGEVFRSQASSSTSNQTAASTPAQSFGTSQTAGSFATSTANTYSGWLAIAQPRSNDAVSDPGGRVYIQYTGDFTTSSGDASGTRTAVTDTARAPITWLNALAASNFSPEQPNLPLLDSATNQSNSGGLMILADPTVGWGDNFGDVMLSADIDGDGIEDLVIAAPQANGGGRVYIINGTWIQNNLTTDNGATILNLANPDDLGEYVVVLTPGVDPDNADRDNAGLAGFGGALAFDDSTGTLWIGASNYLRQLDSAAPQSVAGVQPIGALYQYSETNFNGWSSAQPQSLTPFKTGQGGSITAIGTDGSPSTNFWGSMLGSAVAVSNGQLAVSAPGLSAGLLFSGTEAARKTYLEGKRNPSSSDGDGALIGIQLPDNHHKVDISQGTNSAFKAITTSKTPTDAQSTYMQNLKDAQTDNIVGSTVYNNQSVQAEAIGAVYLYQTSSSNSTNTPEATFYGAAPWNVLGASGFGSSLAFVDLHNSKKPQLAIGADATGGPGAVYLIDHTYKENDLASADALPANEYLAHAVASLTLYGAESQDLFGSGLVNLGDVNQDTYDDLLIQAMNAGSAAGTAYVLFGSDQFEKTVGNPATSSVGSGTIGLFSTADGGQFSSAILQELGYGSGFTGSGNYGSGDINADGIKDIQLGSGPNGSAYLTWGQPYLEAINNLALNKLASNTGYMLDGLATTTPGSLRSIGDFNGDGYGDFMSIQPGELVNNIRIELGANTQETLADYLYNHYNFSVSSDTQALPAGDINGDGLADIALFIDSNLSSADEGNQGAGSTTGILYGRTSEELPIGANFGFLAPVDSTNNNPLSPLPTQQISGGLSSATPAVIAVGTTLYAAVQGNDGNSVWFATSTDAGSTWSTWSNLSETNPRFATQSAPALAFFENKLYLSFLDLEQNLQISKFDPASESNTVWSDPLPIADAQSNEFTSSFAPTLVAAEDSLAICWINPNDGTLYSSASTTPAAGGTITLESPSAWVDVNGGKAPVNETQILAGTTFTGPALAQLGDTIYMAVRGDTNNYIYWTSSTDGAPPGQTGYNSQLQ